MRKWGSCSGLNLDSVPFDYAPVSGVTDWDPEVYSYPTTR